MSGVPTRPVMPASNMRFPQSCSRQQVRPWGPRKPRSHPLLKPGVLGSWTSAAPFAPQSTSSGQPPPPQPILQSRRPGSAQSQPGTRTPTLPIPSAPNGLLPWQQCTGPLARGLGRKTGTPARPDPEGKRENKQKRVPGGRQLKASLRVEVGNTSCCRSNWGHYTRLVLSGDGGGSHFDGSLSDCRSSREGEPAWKFIRPVS